MSETDKTEINSIFESISKMNELNSKLNERYVDCKILDFVNNVVKDFKDNKRFIIDFLNEHQHTIFNLKEIHLCDLQMYAAKRGEITYFGIGCGVEVRAKLNGIYEIRNANCGGYDVSCTSIAVVDVWYHTSDTDDKRYKTCSAWDLVEKTHHEVCKIPYGQAKTAKEWEALYNLATWSRAKNALLVQQFKEALKEIADRMEMKAKSSEKSQLYVKSVNTTYVKVDL